MRQAIKRALPVFTAFAGASLIGTALAASQRTFVASTGLDTNACSISAPCRSFGAAIAKTSAAGEVIVLDSAGYGPVTIDKSISLIAPVGIHAGVTVFSGDGITIDAPGNTVLLRGLSIIGQGGVTGVNVLQVARLRIENCVIADMTGDGVLHGADASALFVVDTTVRNNLGNGIDFVAHGIVVLDRVRSEGNQFDGLFVLSLSDAVDASVTQSHLAYNGRNGINVATSTVLSNPQILVDRSTLEYNGAAGFVLDGTHALSTGTLTRNAIYRNAGHGISVLSSDHGANVTVSENAIGGNQTGIRADGLGVTLDVSGNAMEFQDLAFAQANGAFFGSYRNNIGASATTGTINTLSAK